MPSAPGPRPPRRRVRIVGLAADPASLPSALPIPRPLLDVTLVAGHGGHTTAGSRPYAVELLGGSRPAGPRQRARAAAAWTKTRWLARRTGASADWLWSLKRSTWLRRQVARADLVLSCDTATDRALRAAPDLVHGTPVLLVGDTLATWAALADLERLLEHVDALAEMGRVSGDGRVEEQLAGLRSLVKGVCQPTFPACLLPVETVARLGRDLGDRLGVRAAALVLASILDLPPWPEPERGWSGLAAQRAAADLWLAETDRDRPDEAALAEAVADALEGADAALRDGEGAIAMGRLRDGLALMFHRERHAEVLCSPLVEDPATLLDPLWSSAVHPLLVRGGGGLPTAPSVRPASVGHRMEVLVLTGDYGQFHGAVVTALSQAADVRVLDLRRQLKERFTRSLTTDVLVSLAHLRTRAEGTVIPGIPAPSGADVDVADFVVDAMARADVVFSDWADRATVWASHLRPDGVRLVVRIHSLDALDPWFHLVSWADVDEVIVVSEPLRSLVVDLLAAAGADVPVTVLPNLARLEEMAAPKDEAARSTLGMVGWGRRVKDPLWALDLLAREPSWRLLLIGADFTDIASNSSNRYAATVRQRLLDPDIRDRVEVVGRTRAVRQHLQRVGVILSTSVRESFHLGLVEGAASGAVPVVRNWPVFSSRGGARELFPAEWVVDDLDEAEARVRAVTTPEAWPAQGARAREDVQRLFDPAEASEQYRQLVLGVPVSRCPSL